MRELSAHPLRIAASVGAAVALVASAALATVPAEATNRNLVPNPSAGAVARGVPKGWVTVSAGVNRAVSTVKGRGGKLGGTFVSTRITAYRTGVAGWSSPVAAVRPGVRYTVGDVYRSSAATQLLVAATVRGRTVYYRLGAVRAAATWTPTAFAFVAPAGVTRIRVTHVLNRTGSLDVDDASVVQALAPQRPAPATPPSSSTSTAPGRTPTTPPPASGRGVVSITFDDGTNDHYTNVLPVFKANGQVGTFYLITADIGTGHYLTVAQAKELQAAGNEIGSHTVTHPHLSQLNPAQLEKELADSKKALEANFGPVTDIAYPYGDSSAKVRQVVAKYYASGRSTDGGLNTPGTYDKYKLTIGYVLNTTPLSKIKQWIADAQAKNTWLILCYHGVSNGKPGETYNVQVSDFSAAMAAVKASGVRVATVRDALKLTGN